MKLKSPVLNQIIYLKNILLDKEVCFKILQLSDKTAAKDIEIFYL